MSDWMKGFPPPPERAIRFADLRTLRYPGHKWVYSHWRDLVPTANVWRGPGTPRALPARSSSSSSPLPGGSDALRDFSFTAPDGKPMTLDQMIARTDTDGLLVLRDGQVLFERYVGELQPQTPHRCFSVTKSFVGLLAAMMVHEGALDATALVPSYLPELKRSGWAEATVRQVMDMTTGIRFNEDYEDPASDVVPSRTAYGAWPFPAEGPPGPASTFEYLPTLTADAAHGHAFKYVTPNTEVLAWILQRVSGTTLANLLSQRIWQRIGAQEDACFGLDRAGFASGGGGLCTTLRDLARFGEMIRNRGRVGGDQVVPEAVIDDIANGGDRDAFARAGWDLFAGWSYRNQWWVSHDELGAIRALGVHGQQIYVAPRAGLVITRFGSQQLAVDEDVERTLMAAYRAIAQHRVA